MTMTRDALRERLTVEAAQKIQVRDVADGRKFEVTYSYDSGPLGPAHVVATYTVLGTLITPVHVRHQAEEFASELRRRYVELGAPVRPKCHPIPSTIVNRYGVPCSGANADSYPLTGTCRCGVVLTCADGTADWGPLR